MKKKTERRKWITLGVVIVLIAAVIIAVSTNKNKSDAELRARLLAAEWDFSGENADAYSSYLSRLEKEGKVYVSPTAGNVNVGAQGFLESSGNPAPELTKKGILTHAGGTVTFPIEVPESGTYNIEIGYYPTDDGNLAIVRRLYINGEIPFKGAESLVFDRMWTDASKDFLMRTDRNQGFPSQVQRPEWTAVRLESADRSNVGPYLFYFEKGANTISVEAVQSSLEISYIRLIPSTGVQSYSEYITDNAGMPVIGAEQISKEGYITVQAEDTLCKSTSTLLPQNDRTSPYTVPYHYSNIVLNTIGGSTWNQAGNSITWEVDVPVDGMYRIAARFMQAENRDFYSTREVKINGELPFAEAASIGFDYDSEFQTSYFGNENGAFLFRLNSGINTITMTVTLGNLTYAEEQTSISVKNFNNLFREITAITGSTPDAYRDYDIVSSVPEIVEVMSREYVRLTSVMESLGDTLEENTKTRNIAKLLLQLEKLIKKPDEIATEYSNFSDNITAVADWMLDLDEQPLQLDYIMVCGSGADLPKAEAGFFRSFGHSFMAFIGSFTNDYRIQSDENAVRDKNIVVWIATSTRDQYDIAQRLINNEFKDRDYSVELKMVGAGTVMPATLTGNGPDVAIQLDYSMPTNFAFRNAGYDLSQFPDYEEVASRFCPGALEYFEYNGGHYALPDEMSFPVIFYRTDILDELGLEVPDTWDDLIGILPYIQSENMSIWFSSGTSLLGGTSSTSSKPVSLFFMSRLYQNGVELYRDGGREINLDTLEAGLTFKNWTEYYTKQSFLLSINTITRFRTGECPIIIEDYTLVNTIGAAAPEIEGCWDIAPLPGTRRADGTVDRSTACMVGSSMIVKTSVEKNDTVDEAWEFLKWWTSADTQLRYAEEQKSILGASADFPLANIEAVKARAREKGTIDTISVILDNVRGVPQVPGGYITGREVENAFLSVVSNYSDPVDMLYTKIEDINTELAGKRKEFGLED